MTVIPHALRSVAINYALGSVEFTPSVDPVLYYEARVYAEGTSSPVLATKYLGVPAAHPVTGLIRVYMRTTFDALPAGNYNVGIAAVGAGGVGEAISDIAYTVPLQAP